LSKILKLKLNHVLLFKTQFFLVLIAVYEDLESCVYACLLFVV